MIREHAGLNIFEAQGMDALVNPVNCVGVMGKGLALHFKRRYPYSYSTYRESCEHGRLSIGRVLYVAGEGNEPNTLHFPTKAHWRNKSQLLWIKLGLEYIKKHHFDWHVSTIAMPMIGCGLGGLSWYDVRSLVYEILDDLDTLDVILCVR